MPAEKGEVDRKPYLDGLRGFAAVMVFFGHLAIALMPAMVTFNPAESHGGLEIAVGQSPLSILWQGNFAVCLFFVLSGFLITYLLLTLYRQAHRFKGSLWMLLSTLRVSLFQRPATEAALDRRRRQRRRELAHLQPSLFV